MGLRSFLLRKEYILVNKSEGDTEVGTFPAPRSLQQIKQMIETGDLEDATYKFICRSKTGDKMLWNMPKKKRVSPEQLSRMEQAKVIKALKDKTNDVMRGRDELVELKQEAARIFGAEFGVAGPEIELPDERMSLMDAVNRAMAESAYVSIRKNPDKTTDALFSVVNAATGILTGLGSLLAVKIAEKTEKEATRQVKTVEREIEMDGDRKIVKFKKPEPIVVVKEEEPLETEEPPEEDELEFLSDAEGTEEAEEDK